MKRVLLIGGAPVAGMSLGALLMVSLVAAISGQQTATNTPTDPGTLDIPVSYLADYEQAGAKYGINWTILAGIGEVETDHGRLKAAGVTSGTNYAGAAGPMQFEAPTWTEYGVDGDGDGVKNIYDPADAIPAAARMLRANGAPANYATAIYAYNHSQMYVQNVLTWAGRYATASTTTTETTTAAPDDAAATAIHVALSYLGTPYRWGGKTPATGFDCSGLVQWSYAQAGIALPPNTFGQWDAGLHVPPTQLEPGDIVFFENLNHEGLYLGGGKYVEAPHTGAVVQISILNTASSYYVGAVRPL